MIKFNENTENVSKILVIGIGSSGSSIISRVHKENLSCVNTMFIDSDPETVENTEAKEKICLPSRLIKELDVNSGNVLAAQEITKDLKHIVDMLHKYEIVFTISGLGGGAGTVITPVLTQILREKAFWIWSVCTIPFFFEGKNKIINSLKKLKMIQRSANAVFTIPHDKIFKMVNKNISIKEVFSPANGLCFEFITSIARLTQALRIGSGTDKAGGNWINVKFSDIKNRVANKRHVFGSAAFTTSFGIGEAQGESRIQTAVEQAVNSPLLGKDVIAQAEGMVVCISGNETLSLDEMNKGMEYLRSIVPKDMDISFGAIPNIEAKDGVKVGIIISGPDSGAGADNWDISLSSASMQKDSESGKKSAVFNRVMQSSQKPLQTMIDFKKLNKGRFEKSEATIHGGEDLDVPTFIRKRR